MIEEERTGDLLPWEIKFFLPLYSCEGFTVNVFPCPHFLILFDSVFTTRGEPEDVQREKFPIGVHSRLDSVQTV